MTKVQTLIGVAFTDLPVGEVRQYLQKGNKGGSINGYLEESKTTPVIINAQTIVYIFE